jgi:hypothetical protein
MFGRTYLTFLYLASVATLLTGCANSAVTTDSSVAAVTIEDRLNAWNNPYRYVIWNGESYGPTAFLIVAKDKGIHNILLAGGGNVQIQCVAALGQALKADVTASPNVNGGARKLIPDATTSMSSCEIPENVPHPALGTSEYYVVIANQKISIEGQEPLAFEAFPQHLKDIGATAVVIRKATIADVLCLRAIVAVAGVELKEVNLDGSVTGSKVYGQEAPIEKACNQE